MTANPFPSRAAKAFKCPFCHVSSAQKWAELGQGLITGNGKAFRTLEPREEDEADAFWEQTVELSHWIRSSRWACSLCDNCDRTAVWRDNTMVYPVRSASDIEDAHPDMPESAAALYREARDVVPISRRAGAALARAALERLVKELDPDAPARASLDDRIVRLHTRVSQPLWDLLTVLRHTGNKSLHVDSEPDAATVLVLDPQDEDALPILFGALNDLVDELVLRPRRTSELLAQVPEAVREGARAKVAAAAAAADRA
ncbi:DUF4145 domain-containing protein [Rathayibacter festucae]|uniref:DUF4145 domain-containing protein n=1 Tax=Rathayibacter festucae TaxID=110937 RepID=UPI0013E36FC2|nr:DUF4145 domain-containing protein [Rathayibacter festucae]